MAGITIDGTATVTNEGTVGIGTRGIDAKFRNWGVATLLGTSAQLKDFSNSLIGTLNLGARSQINTSSVIVNEGIIRKDNNAQESIIRGSLTIKDRSLEVKNGASLRIDGNAQSYEGGVITVDGTLLLGQFAAGNASRVFNGLTSISGPGTVNQLKSYEVRKDLKVNLPNTPGYQLGDLVIGDPSQSSGTVKFSNEGHLSITTSENISSVGEGFLPASFHNLSGGTIDQTTTANPSFDVDVMNEGTWNVSSMQISSLINTGSIVLKGQSERITPLAKP